jgi:hypothetical protein
MNNQQIYIALQTIVTKEVRRFTRIWVQTLLPPAITMSLYFVIFGNIVGSRVGQMGGFDYMQYIVPGLIMMSVITNSYSNVVSSFYSAKFQRSIEELNGITRTAAYYFNGLCYWRHGTRFIGRFNCHLVVVIFYATAYSSFLVLLFIRSC